MRMPDVTDVVFVITKLDVEKIAELAKNGENLKWDYFDDGDTPLLVALKNYGEKICTIPSNEKSNVDGIFLIFDSCGGFHTSMLASRYVDSRWKKYILWWQENRDFFSAKFFKRQFFFISLRNKDFHFRRS